MARLDRSMDRSMDRLHPSVFFSENQYISYFNTSSYTAVIFYAFRLPRCVVIIGVTHSASGRKSMDRRMDGSMDRLINNVFVGILL